MSSPDGQAFPTIDQKIFSDLHEQPGVAGICLQAGTHVLSHNLPYSDERVADLAAHVERLCASYENVGRGVWQVLAGFEKHWLLVLTHQSLRLSVLLVPDTDPSPIASRGTRLIVEIGSSAPVTLAWSEPAPVAGPAMAEAAAAAGTPSWTRADFEQRLGNLLGRVAGQETARKIIFRALEQAGVPAAGQISLAQVEAIGLGILKTIPNRGKRQALADEFLYMLNK